MNRTMARACEILFVDPFVPDLATLLAHVRPQVDAVILDPRRPAAQQIAAALGGRDGLDAIHIVAHGVPGQVCFGAGTWSLATLQADAGALAAIGRALAPAGELRLWSCRTAEGEAGAAFLGALAEAVGAEVCASSARIGAAALGGCWELTTRKCAWAARAPMTAAGMGSYAGVLDSDLTLPGPLLLGALLVALTRPSTC